MINVKKVIREHYVKRVIFIILENKVYIHHSPNLDAGLVKSNLINFLMQFYIQLYIYLTNLV
jgi:hypothetical protein